VPNPIEISGPIDKLADTMLSLWTSKNPPAILYRLQNGTTDIVVTIEAYNSRHASRAIYKNNCVSSGWEKLVDCDLKMVDDLIDQFRLLDINASRRIRAATRLKYRRALLMWIMSHEFGHIVLNHGRSDYEEDVKGMHVFDAAKQVKELQADEYSIKIVGDVDKGPAEAYSAILDVANSLIRKSVCPKTFPRVCKEMPPGVGLIFDLRKDANPIRIRLAGTHPEYVARFLRILYLAGIGTSQQNSLTYVAKQAIDLLQVEDLSGSWNTVKQTFERQ
jgi:hypothetical protein